MNTGLIVMAILGCADGGDQCQTVQTVQTQFVSVAECNAAAEASLNRYSGLTYPVIAVRCQKATGPALVEANVSPAG